MVNTRLKNKKTQRRSEALIGSNDDLLMEILLRLPITSVLRFKSVSKHWRSLLSQRPFTYLYKNNSISPGFFVHNRYIPSDGDNQIAPPSCNLDFYPHIRIVQSCNGLLLCCSKQGIQRDRKYYVLNPTTRQIVLIPSVPGGRDVRKTIRFMGLAFHQTDCAHYKVVCFHRTKPDEDLFRILIYSSDTGKWKISDTCSSLSVPYYATLGSGVYWNQTIYCAPFFVNPFYFKIDTEELQSLQLPVVVANLGGNQHGAVSLYFGESRGHLHLVVKSDRSESRFQVYEMLKDRSGWFVKYQVDLDELQISYPEIGTRINEFQVLDVVRGEEEDDETFMVIRITGNFIIRYNVAGKSFKQIYNMSTFIDGPIDHSNVHRYIETIVSI